MKLELCTLLSVVTSLLLKSEHVFSSPVPRAHHQIHIDQGLIDSIFQIPIQTLSAVGNLLKNVHTAKRNFLSVNVHVGQPEDYPESSGHPAHKPDTSSYPANKPDTSPQSGFPDYQPDYNPVIPDSSPSVRPPSVSVSDPGSPSYGTTSGFGGDTTYLTELQTASSSVAPPFKPVVPTAQPSYQSSATAGQSKVPSVQPLAIDLDQQQMNNRKEQQRKDQQQKEKNFREYVQKKLAEKNLQDNRISPF